MAQLLTGLPLAAFLPVTPDPVTVAAGSPYQPLGYGYRGATRSIGAIDPAPVARVLLAH